MRLVFSKFKERNQRKDFFGFLYVSISYYMCIHNYLSREYKPIFRRLFSIYIFLLTFVISLSFGQETSIAPTPNLLRNIVSNDVTDSLKSKKYEYLADMFYKKELTDSYAAKIYAESYLLKAKKDKDFLKVADGYYFLCSISKGQNVLKYSDSIIKLTKHLKKHKFYPAYGYQCKAQLYFEKRDFKKSTDNYLLALNYAETGANNFLAFQIKHTIGLLKSRVGDYGEALILFKECLQYRQSLSIENDSVNYLKTLWAISDSYMRENKLDSASFFNNKGYKESKIANEGVMENYFVMNEGANQYWKSNFGPALDSLEKTLPILYDIDDKPNIAFAHFYIGKSLLKKKDTIKAVIHLKKIDSVYSRLGDIHPEIREGYELLINYYKRKKNTYQQLFYIERLMKVDSTLNSDYKYLIKNINQKYDSRLLKKERNTLRSGLDKEKQRASRMLIIFLILILILLGLYYFNNRKKKLYKTKFEELLIKKQEEKIEKTKISEKPHLSEDIINQITEKLNQFVEDKKYLNQDISINNLAKKINTNAKYLSKTIQYKEQKSFIDYINGLRVDHAVNKLKKDSKFRKYTIKAISDHVGFNNPTSFSRAFVKKTGIKPSYFIQELEKREDI